MPLFSGILVVSRTYHYACQRLAIALLMRFKSLLGQAKRCFVYKFCHNPICGKLFVGESGGKWDKVYTFTVKIVIE